MEASAHAALSVEQWGVRGHNAISAVGLGKRRLLGDERDDGFDTWHQRTVVTTCSRTARLARFNQSPVSVPGAT